MSTPNFDLPIDPLVESLYFALESARSPTVRPISEWVEQEVILPNGPFANERYRHDRHPVSRPWFEALDSGEWTRYAACGPTQNGKTLLCYVIPVCYHLFEVGETVIVGLPDMGMAADKWEQDFLPVVEASRYRELLPTTGEGSRGGVVKRAIRFRNGATLRFMSGGGSDKKRAGYTSRVLAVTEVDGMDEPGQASREADKIEQLEGRTRAFGRTGKRVYLECTVSIEQGRIWQEVKRGTDSRLARPCPHCGEWVTPEREHLKGWQDAESEEEAAAKAAWHCPSCDHPWTDEERAAVASNAILVHRGQSVDNRGRITGDPPQTQTLGFRWSAIDNPFQSAGDVGAEEWLANKSRDKENAEKKQRQFVFALPYDPPDVDLTQLDPDAIEARTSGLKRGVVPEDCVGIAVGVDTGRRQLHWVAIAVRLAGPWPVIEYGEATVEADRLGTQRGLLAALQQLRSYWTGGWRSLDGRQWTPAQVLIDSGYHEHQAAVYQLCAVANQGLSENQVVYRPGKGFGEGQLRMGRYLAPNKRTADVVAVGDNYDLRRVRKNGKLLPNVVLCHINVDQWKSLVHEGLTLPPEELGAITLWETADTYEHSTFAQHLVAETQVEKFLPGRGRVIVWDRVNRNNHYLDATCYAAVAADLVPAIVAASAQQTPKKWFGKQPKSWYAREDSRGT